MSRKSNAVSPEHLNGTGDRAMTEEKTEELLTVREVARRFRDRGMGARPAQSDAAPDRRVFAHRQHRGWRRLDQEIARTAGVSLHVKRAVAPSA